MKKLSKLKICTFLFITLIIITTTSSLAAFATSIGTIEHVGSTGGIITSSGLVNTAKNYYLGLRIFTK